MNADDSATCSVLLIDDQAFSQDIIAHSLSGCADIALHYDPRARMAVELALETRATVVLMDLLR